MALESATYISDLVAANPLATDGVSVGDDHIRLIKNVTKATFPNVTGAVTPTHTELNYVDGVTSAIQTQLDSKTSRSYLAGYALSTGGGSVVMSIAAGSASDSTNAVVMSRAVITKTTSAWSLGDAVGGLDTGAIANSTWYHFYVIRRPDTGVVDVVFSTSASAPTLPTNYTQYRRIGSGKTNGSAQWTNFSQMGDRFMWVDPVADIAATNPGTSAVTRTLTVPTGVVVIALVNTGQFNNGGWGSATGLYLSPLTATDTAPDKATTGFTVSSGKGTTDMDFNYAEVVTNTSAQIRSRADNSEASGIIYITTIGWVDTRGRDS